MPVRTVSTSCLAARLIHIHWSSLLSCVQNSRSGFTTILSSLNNTSLFMCRAKNHKFPS
uniref:Uncharacterized protein n=1 Tax=Arundo donax TaxID=35708 RepID=A0A0A9C161_ARUDO